ncbi:hypothetical protein MHL31_16175 [Lutibacter sp. A80]|uniref:hypothetical protein n=1 Tax=Lutibacter sp. A80 TaxID=2918453 RepID=UPI001F05665B|nr:hypothetical protein [Lutibacter sp. A80]UMB60600.1 hypothetical protein MHL31_16175 [Lutibacter sp. A80]
MKNQFLGIFFYLLYLLAMIRPVMPIINYYANYDYIAAELCENKDKPYLECNGKCYLKKQLKEVNHTNHDHKSTVPQINFDDYPITTLDQFTYQFIQQKQLLTITNYCIYISSQDFFKSDFKPPQVLG